MLSEKELHSRADYVVASLLAILRSVCDDFRNGRSSFDLCVDNYNTAVSVINAYYNLGLINGFIYKVACDKAFKLVYVD